MNILPVIKSTNSSPLKKKKRLGIFGGAGKRNHLSNVTTSSSPENMLESTESSVDPLDIKAHVGELSLHFYEENNNSHNKNSNQNDSISIADVLFLNNNNNNNNNTKNTHNNHSSSNNPNPTTNNNDDSMKKLILSYKQRRPRPLADTKAPPKPYRNRSFKIDGVPACVSKEIERNARTKADKRRQRQQEKCRSMLSMYTSPPTNTTETTTPDSTTKTAAATGTAPMPTTNNTAVAPVSVATATATTTTLSKRKQRLGHFLKLPHKNHPLYWDATQLSPTDFAQDERIYLAQILQNPRHPKSVVTKTNRPMISRRVESTLEQLHYLDWDCDTLGRAATTLFFADATTGTNALHLSPAVAQYFYQRFQTLKTNLEHGVLVSYSTNIGDQMLEYDVEGGTNRRNNHNWQLELFKKLRMDFEQAILSYNEVSH